MRTRVRETGAMLTQRESLAPAIVPPSLTTPTLWEMRVMHLFLSPPWFTIHPVRISCSTNASCLPDSPGPHHPMAGESRGKGTRPRRNRPLSHVPAGCNARILQRMKTARFGLSPYFFCFFCPQETFCGYRAETVAPLHPTPHRFFIFNGFVGVQRGVQQGATGCNAGATEEGFLALHPHVSMRNITLLSYRMKWCTAFRSPNVFSGGGK